MPISEIETLLTPKAELAESPTWDAVSGHLIWLDVAGRHVHRLDPLSGRVESFSTPHLVGAIAPRASGGFIVAHEDGFGFLDRAGAFTPITNPLRRDVEERMNDGKCDSRGRFWAGTISRDRQVSDASLYCLDVDQSVTTALTGVTLSNGIAWSPDDFLMYYIDTPSRQVRVFDFDIASGALSDGRPFVDIPPEAGLPDGMATDVEGCVWVALWGGAAIRRYTPDGVLDRVYEFPVCLITSLAFGGEDLGDLYVTSAARRLSAESRSNEPAAGRLFRLRPGVTGVPTRAYGG